MVGLPESMFNNEEGTQQIDQPIRVDRLQQESVLECFKGASGVVEVVSWV